MYIEAIMWYFSMTRGQAEQYYKSLVSNNELSTLYEILKAYQNTAKMSFYND